MWMKPNPVDARKIALKEKCCGDSCLALLRDVLEVGFCAKGENFESQTAKGVK